MEQQIDSRVMKEDLKNMSNFLDELYMIFNSTENEMTDEQKKVSEHYKTGISQIRHFLAMLGSQLID